MLVVDCGNSRIKWARWRDGGLDDRGAGPVHDAATHAALGEVLSDESERVLIANVAGERVAESLDGIVRSRLGSGAQFIRVERVAHGIECAYEKTETLGVDRWLAMIAARRRTREAVAVVGAGTAVTFDAVDVNGRHLGGLILPGDGLMIDALAGAAAQIGVVPRAPSVPGDSARLGRSTESAVGLGCRLALVAAIDRAVGEVTAALGSEPHVFVTGGDAELVAAWLASKAEVSADLVLEGLVVAGGSE